jgi:lipopolysaccharide biosynthesis glycosyltransferase
MTTTAETLKEMARLTMLSSRISDVQIKNLQYFPLVFFNDVSEVKIEYDLLPDKSISDEPTKCSSLISYYLTIDEPKNDNLGKRFLALEESVRSLFWDDIKVEVYFNGQIKYKSVMV